MKRIPRTALIAAGLVAMASIVGGGIVFAESSSGSSSSTATSASTKNSDIPAVGQQAGPNANISDYINQLAHNLGIDPQKLKDAISQTNTDELNKAVANGTITQAQADRIKQALQSGNSFFFFGGNGPKTPGGNATPGSGGPGHGGFGGIMNIENDVATFLGVTPAQLRTDMMSGKSLADEATAHGKTVADLKAYLTTQVTNEVNQAVSSGRITQAQADQLLSNLSSRLDQIINAKPGSMMPRGFGLGPNGNGPTTPGGGSRQTPGTPQQGLN